jgi:polyhydroxyalkanoate synthesis repressor PhaR
VVANEIRSFAPVTTQKPNIDKRLIKRYGNRKLYDVSKSRYITLDGIRALVQAGEDVQVVDNRTGEDLTGVTFAQIIYETEKRSTGALTLPLLRRMVEIGDETVQRSREALESVVDAAEKRVRKLVGGEGTHFLEDVLDLPQRRLEEIQKRIDHQVRQSVEKVTHNPVLQSELRRVESNLRQLEAKLAELTGSSQPRSKAKSSGKRSGSKTKRKPTQKKKSAAK